MLGIVIGIGSVIALVAIGKGAKARSSRASNRSARTSHRHAGSAAELRLRRVGRPRHGADPDRRRMPTPSPPGVERRRRRARSHRPRAGHGQRHQYQHEPSSAPFRPMPAVRNVTVAEGSFITDDQISPSLTKSPSSARPSRPTSSPRGTDPVGQTIRIKEPTSPIIGVTVAKGGSGFSNQTTRSTFPLHGPALSHRQPVSDRDRHRGGKPGRHDPGAERRHHPSASAPQHHRSDPGRFQHSEPGRHRLRPPRASPAPSPCFSPRWPASRSSSAASAS